MRWSHTCRVSASTRSRAADPVGVGTFRGLITLFVMLAFIGVVFWAYSKRRKKDFDEMANLPFNEYPSDKDKGSKTP
jgi:cbb3-type cytochrome oxidase subunit 3